LFQHMVFFIFPRSHVFGRCSNAIPIKQRDRSSPTLPPAQNLLPPSNTNHKSLIFCTVQ
jgi:hypothetical protein